MASCYNSWFIQIALNLGCWWFLHFLSYTCNRACISHSDWRHGATNCFVWTCHNQIININAQSTKFAKFPGAVFFLRVWNFGPLTKARKFRPGGGSRYISIYQVSCSFLKQKIWCPLPEMSALPCQIESTPNRLSWVLRRTTWNSNSYLLRWSDKWIKCYLSIIPFFPNLCFFCRHC